MLDNKCPSPKLAAAVEAFEAARKEILATARHDVIDLLFEANVYPHAHRVIVFDSNTIEFYFGNKAVVAMSRHHNSWSYAGEVCDVPEIDTLMNDGIVTLATIYEIVGVLEECDCENVFPMHFTKKDFNAHICEAIAVESPKRVTPQERESTMIKQKAEIVIKFTADLDMIPGWGHHIEDWVALVKRQLQENGHYNTKAEIISANEIEVNTSGRRTFGVFEWGNPSKRIGTMWQDNEGLWEAGSFYQQEASDQKFQTRNQAIQWVRSLPQHTEGER